MSLDTSINWLWASVDYWKTIRKVLYTGCPKKVTEFQIEMAANIWPRKSDHFFFENWNIKLRGWIESI